MDRKMVVLLLLSFLSLSSFGAELLDNEILESVETGSSAANTEKLHRFLSPIAAEVMKLKSRVSDMEEKVQQLQQENRELTWKLGRYETRVEQLETLNQCQAAELRNLKNQTNVTETQLDSLRREREVSRVAFSGSLWTLYSDDYIGPADIFITLVFKEMFANVGGAYNTTTGMFTAPVGGAYHFEYYCNSGEGLPGTGVVLARNGWVILAAEEVQSSGSGTAANGATLILEAGEVISLHLWPGSRILVGSNHPSTFSGRLLFTL